MGHLTTPRHANKLLLAPKGESHGRSCPRWNLWWFSSACQCSALSWKLPIKKSQSLWPDIWFSTAVDYMRIVWNCTKLEHSGFVFQRIQSKFSIIGSPSFGHFLSALLICTLSIPNMILGVSSGCVLSKLQLTHDGVLQTKVGKPLTHWST